MSERPMLEKVRVCMVYVYNFVDYLGNLSEFDLLEKMLRHWRRAPGEQNDLLDD